MKFVKGDAIAGIIVILINLIGGFAIGIMQKGMAPDEAISTYSLLTVGDGLAAQIPALLISVATGIIVTRSASERIVEYAFQYAREADPNVLLFYNDYDQHYTDEKLKAGAERALEAAQAGHAHVQHDGADRIAMELGDEGQRISPGAHPQADGADEQGEAVAHRLVVIDQVDQRDGAGGVGHGGDQDIVERRTGAVCASGQRMENDGLASTAPAMSPLMGSSIPCCRAM